MSVPAQSANRTEPTRALRRDAQRNLDRLTQAARELFAERGVDVPLEEIAKRAGVSVGTLYNRFPDRFALIDAVLYERVTASLEIGRTALTREDPWPAFAGYLEQICELQARDRGVVDALNRRFPRTPRLDAACDEGFAQAGELIRRAQESGALRPDFTVSDLVGVLWANASVVRATAGVEPNAWRRHLGFILDGLRPTSAHHISDPPLNAEQLDAARRAAASESFGSSLEGE